MRGNSHARFLEGKAIVIPPTYSTALDLLRINYPEEYALIHDYYLSGEKMTLVYLAKRFKMSRQVTTYKLNNAIALLKNYIISHENSK